MERAYDLVLICRGDAPEVADVFTAEIEASGRRVWCDGPWVEQSQKRRAELLRRAYDQATAAIIVVSHPMPNTRQFRIATELPSSLRRIAVVLDGPAPEQVSDSLGESAQVVDLRNAPSLQDAALVSIGVLSGQDPPVEYACLEVAAPEEDASSASDGSAAEGTSAAADEVASESSMPSTRKPRAYASERATLPRLRQWFSPLPNRPRVPPLGRAEIEARLPPSIDPEVATQFLEEAVGVMDRRTDRIDVAESKATTLMGTVGVASGLVIAGAALILDPSKITNPWRQILTVVVAALLFFLLMCGYTASRALLRVFLIRRPQPRHAIRRASRADVADSARERAIDLLDRAGSNLYVADYKLAQVRVAYRWYQWALVTFLLLGLTLATYALFGDAPGRA